MKVICKDIEMIAYFKENGYIEPIRFRIEEEGKLKVVKINKVINEEIEKLCGNKMLVFKCTGVINNTEKIMEIKYDTEKCKWILFKV